ncbi:hypothetical protein AGMMS49579_03850 [Spirochaetia bacterium]|nr:hypothetical protein AGMMS49579_03850 [Spirochaetia bacterium]
MHQHQFTIENICISCGLEQNNFLSFNNTTMLHHNTTSILNQVKSNNFLDEIKNLYIPEHIKLESYRYFLSCNSNHRSRLKRSIIFGCIYLTCIKNNYIQNINDLMIHFNLNYKNTLEGIRKVKILIPELRTIDEDSWYYLQLYCKNLSLDYNIIPKTVDISFHSNPKVVALILIYKWLNVKNLSFTDLCKLCSIPSTLIKKLKNQKHILY